MIKPSVVYVQHFPYILAISNISTTFQTFFGVSRLLKPFPTYIGDFLHIQAVCEILKPFPT